ncbi:hypothetical protein [Brevibacillus choshinensis]|uniref:hypothetical protein n=1 Tax=Brevibacillus choshinensis TaxID=54911 RepID=UPI0006EBFEF5|nr:hypothetical protein [Brevibacillus choshinensis]
MRNIKVLLTICFILTFGFATYQPADAAKPVKEQSETSIPMLASLSQISANQLQVTYDQPVDQAKGMDPKNYWIQSTTEQTPTNIATLGMNDKVNNSNSLTAEKVAIQASGNNGQSFVLTFQQNIAKGKSFKMIICYVTRPGAPPYSGDNGSATFIGK